MRITLCSPGMNAAAPMVVNPVGCRLSDLPLVDANDGYRLHRFLEKICDAPREHDHTKTFVLHLVATSRRVLFEMTASLVPEAASESGDFIVLTGRQIDDQLAGLLRTCQSTVTPSHDSPGHFSQPGSIYDVDDENYHGGSNHGGSDVSSLTMTTITDDDAAAADANAHVHSCDYLEL